MPSVKDKQRRLISTLSEQKARRTPNKGLNDANFDAIVVYDSWTGNTEKVAKAIANGLGTTAIHVKNNPPRRMKLLVVGSPVHFGATNRILEYLKTVDPEAMAIFLTYGATGKLARHTIMNSLKQMKMPGVDYLGTFISKGFHPILLLYQSHPDNKDLKDAKQFGGELRIEYMGDFGDQGLGYVMVPWMNQNLPFACGISQGVQEGLKPEDYEQDPDNWRSSKKWFTRGYKLGEKYRVFML